MKASAKIENPDVAELTLTLTMPVKEWKEFSAQLPRKWPSWQVGDVIDRAIRGTIAHVERVHEDRV